MKQDLYNIKGEVVGATEVPDAIFAAKWNAELVRQVLIAQLANKRRPWAHAKDRSEVRGGGRKPWRQKGTGRARHGSRRSPIWIGGGKAHGPRNEKDYSQKVNKKMKKAALFALLSNKLKGGTIRFFDGITIAEPKTKELFTVLSSLRQLSKRAKKLDVLVIASDDNKKVFPAARNLVKAKAVHPQTLNVYDVSNFKYLYIEKDAVSQLAHHFGDTAKKITKKKAA